MFMIFLPTMISEFAIGTAVLSDVVESFSKISRAKQWIIGGWLGVITSFLIVSFYAVIVGWVLYYIFSYLTGSAQQVETGGMGEFFETFIGNGFIPVVWQLIVM